MPLSKDPKGGGTEKDGSFSKTYCSYCYEKGAFTPDVARILTAAEMQSYVIRKLNQKGVPKIIGWSLTRSIPKLKRWHADYHH